jgi:hypothetical protein
MMTETTAEITTPAVTGPDHVGLTVRNLEASINWYEKVDGPEGLEAQANRLGSLDAGHSGIQSVKEPFVFSTVIFRDIDNNQLEFIAVGV